MATAIKEDKEALNAKLSRAVLENKAEEVRSLLKNCTDVNFPTRTNIPLLTIAVFNRNIQIAQMLLEKGADIELKNYRETTALIVASSLSTASTVSIAGKACTHMVKLLLDAGANTESRDGSGNTALIRSIQTHNLQATKLLLERGADVEASSKDGSTALMYAAFTQNADAMRVLLEHGALVDIVNKSGMAAADYYSKGEIGQILLEYKDQTLERKIQRQKQYVALEKRQAINEIIRDLGSDIRM